VKRKPILMTVTLSSVGNSDHGQFCGSNVLSPDQQIQVRDFTNASEICRAYITRYDLGARNWTGGTIKQGNKVVANVSYNGRVWLVTKRLRSHE
jgi:hypothetical protein